MATIDDVLSSKEEDDKLRSSNPKTPDVFAFDCGQLPFERMGDDHFELMLADLYTARADDGKEDWFDKACRLNDGADQGRDVILLQDSVPVGVIQCKRYKGNVGRPQIIQEICKFFMYAKIMPQIAPAPDTEFRYYVAVSDGATSDLFEFMTSKGRKRFDDLRSEFEKKALAARNASKKLKEHPELKDLDKKQLCDIVWERITNLHTELHKKDSLSRMVSDYPSIKSNYFRLESDTAKVVDEIKKILSSRGTTLSDDDAKLVSHVRTEYIKLTLSSSSRFNIALIQGKELLPFIRGMLKPKSGTLYTNFGSRPALMTAGAKAAEASQWSEINNLVNDYPYPLVFSVGCGDVLGSTLLEWIESDDMSWIDPKWKPAPARLYKAGWCWVKDPEQETHDCYILVENETGDQKYDHANMSLRLAFEDVIVWPTLGNDFTNPIGNAKSLLRRIMASQAEDRAGRRNLVLASQDIDSIDKVLESVPDYHGQRNQSPIAITIANSGRLHDCNVGLYCATGVFPAIDTEHNTRATPPTVQPPSRVMRRSCNGALTLTINWTTELLLEFAKSHRLIGNDVKDDLSPEALEFHELFDRHPPIDGYLESVRKELELLNVLVQNASLADSKEFTYRTKYGVMQDQSFSLDDMSASGEYVMQAVQALSYIKSHKSTKWIVESGGDGHIEYSDPAFGEFNVLAWTNHRYPVRQMEADLFGWARKAATNPSLIVFADAKGRVNDKKPSHGRHDFTSPPPLKGTITEAEEPSNVYIFDLGEIESYYDDDGAPSVEQFMDDILERRKKLDDK
ncbi:ABC-three component system protein [Photobacterium atrarenae]|uniref:Restriction endonuclease n=1 Tax=Photobacterium atrarenae TaxID=865757 RepID=A0ABY5GLR2_9GAMM|nr:ABC-three component system protein [Photobacterium atrarenae]UTV30263.1 restriction endonuclease [Photobacterium atrarenae]